MKSMYSIYTFSSKIGANLASTVASYALGLIGYVAGAASQPVGVAENKIFKYRYNSCNMYT